MMNKIIDVEDKQMRKVLYVAGIILRTGGHYGLIEDSCTGDVVGAVKIADEIMAYLEFHND